MSALDYIFIILYFVGLVGVSLVLKGRIRNSQDMFIAGRNSSWWLSGISSYMSIFSASTFVIWGGVAYKSGLVAAFTGYMFFIAAIIVGVFIAGKWRRMRINSPGSYLALRFGKSTVNFYTISGIIGRGVHTAVALYAVSIVLCALTGISIWTAILILGFITLAYTIVGGFLAVLVTDFIQFAVLLCVVVFLIPLSFKEVGGVSVFLEKASQIPGFFSGTSETYTWLWMVLWVVLNVAYLGGDFPFVQRYISVPTTKDARKSIFLVGILYLLTPLLWYLPAMIYRVLVPGPGMDVDPAAMTAIGESAYVEMGKMVLMKGMLGIMMAAMLSATMSNVSGTLNVYANVFTYDIWNVRHKDATEKEKIRAGRLFTMFFGLSIIAVALLIPFAGGAEKVVIPLLTMVLCPLYIPSVWGLFSKRLTGNQLMSVMIASWAIGFTLKFTVPAEVITPSVLESLSGCILPVVILGALEIVSAIRGKIASGAQDLLEIADVNADSEPDAATRKATRDFSRIAINCFCITIGIIAILLLALLLAGDERAIASKAIVGWFVFGIALLLIVAYLPFRKRKDERIVD